MMRLTRGWPDMAGDVRGGQPAAATGTPGGGGVRGGRAAARGVWLAWHGRRVGLEHEFGLPQAGDAAKPSPPPPRGGKYTPLYKKA